MKKYSLDCFFRLCSEKAIILAIPGVFAVAFSCTTALYIPSSNQETNTATFAELQSGRKRYIQKCGSCHSLYLPEKYTKQQWKNWVDKMEPRSKIDSIDKIQIFKYVSKGK